MSIQDKGEMPEIAWVGGGKLYESDMLSRSSWQEVANAGFYTREAAGMQKFYREAPSTHVEERTDWREVLF